MIKIHTKLSDIISAYTTDKELSQTIRQTAENDRCWGFTEDKETIHIWYDNTATISDLIELIAHELGHCMKPHHKDRDKEEGKADSYSSVSLFAYHIANVIKTTGRVVYE